MTELEKEVESRLVKMAKTKKGLCLKFVSPGNAGVPDRIILIPQGKIIFVETKRPKQGRISALQQWWANKIIALGFEHKFICSVEQIKELEDSL